MNINIVKKLFFFIGIPLILLIISLIFVNPFFEASIFDEFSYYYLAVSFYEKGIIEYNRWGAMPMIFQCIWAFPFLEILGVSFKALKIANLFFCFGSIVLIYLVSCEYGLSSKHRTALLSWVVSIPYFCLLSWSFMTDLPALFFYTLCLYISLKMITADKHFMVSMAFIFIFGVVGGSIRQSLWLPQIFTFLFFAWKNRHIPSRLFYTALLLFLTLISFFIIHKWFYGQPQADANFTAIDLSGFKSKVKLGVFATYEIVLSLSLFLFPFIAMFNFSKMSTLKIISYMKIVFITVALLIMSKHWSFWPYQMDFRFPFMKPECSFFEICHPDERMPYFSIKFIMNIICIINISIFISVISFKSVISYVVKRDKLILFALLVIANLIGIIIRKVFFRAPAFDRYFLPCLFIIAIPMVHKISEQSRRHINVFIILGIIFNLCCLCSDRYFFARYRARIEAVKEISKHYKREEILSGMDLDGFYQIEKNHVIGNREMKIGMKYEWGVNLSIFNPKVLISIDKKPYDGFYFDREVAFDSGFPLGRGLLYLYAKIESKK